MTGLTSSQSFLKRCFDVIFASIGLFFLSPVILFAFIVASLDTRQNGLFCQVRIGRFGEPFSVLKIRTMTHSSSISTTVTTSFDPRVTRIGSILRAYKLDELPQLWNVLKGQMSFVGPRPDVPGFADCLVGDDRVMLMVRPGITGPASLKYKHEAVLLAMQDDPEKFNMEVIWPDKVKLNCDYVKSWSFYKDIILLIRTLVN